MAVFQDVAWARKGLDALKQAGLPAESLTILAKDSPDVAALIQAVLGSAGDALELAGSGTALMPPSALELSGFPLPSPRFESSVV